MNMEQGDFPFQCKEFRKLLFSHPAMCGSLWPNGLLHTRPPSPSPFPQVCPSSCPLLQWCHPAISSSDYLFSFCPQSLPESETFPDSAVCIRWPKYWSFSFSVSLSEYSELISLKIDWFHILVQGTFRSLLQTEMTCTHAWVFRVEMPTVWLVNWEENQEIKIGYISRSWIAGSRGNSIFNFLRNLHTIFHNSCTNLQSHQQYTSFPFSPHSHQQFLTTTILTCVSWYLMAVLLCIPITISVAEYFSYTCHILLVICMSSLQKCL